MGLSRQIPRFQAGNVDDNSTNTCPLQNGITIHIIMQVLVANQHKSFTAEFFTILAHTLGNNPNEQITPTTDYAEELQNRTRLLIDRIKQNISHS